MAVDKAAGVGTVRLSDSPMVAPPTVMDDGVGDGCFHAGFMAGGIAWHMLLGTMWADYGVVRAIAISCLYCKHVFCI